MKPFLSLVRSGIIGFGYFLWSLFLGVYRAWALTMIWGWFLVGFMGIPALPLWVAFGVSILVSFLTTNEAHARFLVKEKMLVKEKKDSLAPHEAFMETYFKWFNHFVLISFTLLGAWIWVLLRPFLFGI